MIATQAHIPALRSLRDLLELVAIADRRPDVAQRVANFHGIPAFYQDASEMLDKTRPDVVSICTSNSSHSALCKLALQAGVHVLCEKPLALSYRETREVFETAANAGVKVMACQSIRANPEFFAAKEFIQNGCLGQLYYAEINRVRRRGVPAWGKFYQKEANGGGALCDVGVHQIDALLWMMGNPALQRITGTASANIVRGGHLLETSLKESGAPLGVSERVSYAAEAFEVEEFASGAMVLEGNIAVNFKVAWAANLPESAGLSIVGDRAGVLLPNLQVIGAYQGRQADITPRILAELSYPDHPFKGHFFVVDNFVHAVMEDGPLLVAPYETLNVAAVLDGFYRAAKLGREVTMQEIESVDV